MITVSVEGEGRLRREVSFSGNFVKTYFGKALVVVQSTRKPGPIIVNIQLEGFDEPFKLALNSRH